jgi:hypothetical protein
MAIELLEVKILGDPLATDEPQVLTGMEIRRNLAVSACHRR